MKWREFEEKQVWKDQKRHQMEKKRICCCWECEKTKWEWRWMNERVENEIFQVVDVGKHSRGKGCQLIVTDKWRTNNNEDENEEGKEREMKWESSQVGKVFKKTWKKGGDTVGTKRNRRVIWRFARIDRKNEKKKEKMERDLRERIDHQTHQMEGRWES